MTHEPQGTAIVSVDAACSGRRATCAAVLAVGDRVVAEQSRSLGKVDGYVLAAEIGAVALGAELVADYEVSGPIIVEVDNPQVPRVLLEGLMPPQAERIPADLLSAAAAFVATAGVTLRVLPRNASAGLRRADRLAGKWLWGR